MSVSSTFQFYNSMKPSKNSSSYSFPVLRIEIVLTVLSMPKDPHYFLHFLQKSFFLRPTYNIVCMSYETFKHFHIVVCI